MSWVGPKQILRAKTYNAAEEHFEDWVGNNHGEDHNAAPKHLLLRLLVTVTACNDMTRQFSDCRYTGFPAP
jgi:hypothetical protein